MASGVEILTRDQMSAKYGAFYALSGRAQVDQANVPRELWPIIAYAEFWGIGDDLARERLVRRASREALDNLKAMVRTFDDALDAWLAGPNAADPHPSKEYIAFSAMRMAADFA